MSGFRPGWFASSTRHLPDPGRDVRIGPVRWRFAPGEDALAAHLRRLVLEPWASLPDMELLRLDPKVFWGRVQLPGGDYFLKGRRVRRRRLRYLWTASAVRREWRRSFALRARGIDTPAPAAVGELRRFRFPRIGFYASRWREGASLEDHLEAEERALPPRDFARVRRGLAEELGGLLGRLHHAGVVHRQFHGRNVFVVDDAQGRMLIPIDCQHVGIPRRFRDADRAYNLRQAAWWLRDLIARWRPSRAERVRFLRGYHRASPESAASFAELVERASRLMARPGTAKPSPSRALDRW